MSTEGAATEEEEELVVSIVCSTCRGAIRLGDVRCTGCGREVTDEEAQALRRRLEASDPEAARAADQVVYGRFALLMVAGFQLLSILIYGFIGESVAAVVLGLGLMGLFIGLFLWSGRRPMAALIIGITVYVMLQLGAFLVSPWTLAEGWLVKCLVLSALAAGIAAQASREAREFGTRPRKGNSRKR